MSKEKEDQPHYIFKLCLIGGGGVGKTCIARRLCFNTFDINTKLTIGIDFYTYDLPIIVKGEETFVRLSIWDFGGQAQFKKLFSYYINGANGIFMVFDTVNLQTLLGLDWWYENLSKFNQQDTPRIVVAAKNDLIRERDPQAVVDELVIQQFMKRQNEEFFYRTSSKDNVNIRTIFVEMTKLILESHKLVYDQLI